MNRPASRNTDLIKKKSEITLTGQVFLDCQVVYQNLAQGCREVRSLLPHHKSNHVDDAESDRIQQ